MLTLSVPFNFTCVCFATIVAYVQPGGRPGVDHKVFTRLLQQSERSETMIKHKKHETQIRTK